MDSKSRGRADGQVGGRAHGRAIRWLLLTVPVAVTLWPNSLSAQYADAWVNPRGTLRVSFEPMYINFGQRFDTLGNVEALGTDFSDDSAGVRLIPTLYDAQAAIWSISGDSSIAINTGAFRTTLESDIRRLPFNFAFGLTDRLTLTASVPLVTTRSQVDLSIDSTDSDLGWNQASPGAANAAAAAQIQSLLNELETAASFVEGQIAANGYDCPTGPTCDQARDAVLRARQMQADVTLLSGVDAAGGTATVLTPFAPIGGSVTGVAVTTAIASLVADLQSLGAPAVTSSFPLPSEPVTTSDVETLSSDPAYGYSAPLLGLTKYSNRIGDVEVGMRFGIAQNEKLRAVLIGNVRLPTGNRDVPDNYTDIGPGDKQTDIEFGIQSVWMPGTFLALAIDAMYTMQLGDRLERRVTPPDRPFATLATQATVQRNLGDILRVGVYPSLRLSEGFTAYGSATFLHKSADAFTLTGALDVPPSLGGPVSAADLERNTSWRSLSFGGGIYLRMDRGAVEPKLPIEGGVDYRSAFSGSGGLTPKTTTVNFFLRLYWRLWGGPPPAEEAPTPSP